MTFVQINYLLSLLSGIMISLRATTDTYPNIPVRIPPRKGPATNPILTGSMVRLSAAGRSDAGTRSVTTI